MESIVTVVINLSSHIRSPRTLPGSRSLLSGRAGSLRESLSPRQKRGDPRPISMSLPRAPAVRQPLVRRGGRRRPGDPRRLWQPAAPAWSGTRYRHAAALPAGSPMAPSPGSLALWVHQSTSVLTVSASTSTPWSPALSGGAI